METTEVWRYSGGVWSTQWLTRDVPDAVVRQVEPECTSATECGLYWIWDTGKDCSLSATLDDAKAAAEEALRKRRGEGC